MFDFLNWWHRNNPSIIEPPPSPLPAKEVPVIPPRPDKPEVAMVTEEELDVGAKAVREAIDATGYGSWVKDEYCRSLAADVGLAMARVRHPSAEPPDPA